jgi:hypothetical protein
MAEDARELRIEIFEWTPTAAASEGGECFTRCEQLANSVD